MRQIAVYDPATTTAEQEAESEERFLTDMLTERWYQDEMLPQVRKDVREFVAELGGYKRLLRAKIFHDLREWFRLADVQEKWVAEFHREHKASDVFVLLRPYFIRGLIEEIEGKMNRLDRQVKITKDRLDNKPMPKGHITEEMIARAREYPIEQILAGRGEHPIKGKYLCIYHKEKTPSMSIKHNRIHCFGCGKKDDAIGVYRHLTNESFPYTIKKLCGGA